MTNSRSKGRRGETSARHLLESRDYTCEDLSAGRASCDILAIKNGIAHYVEVKNRQVINPVAFRKQAVKNCKSNGRWMVLAKIEGSRSWLVLRQGERPVVWHEPS